MYYNATWQCNATPNASVLLPPQCYTLQYIQMQLIYYDFENAECSGAATPQCNQYNTLHWNATNLLKHWMQRRCSTSTSTAKSISFSSPISSHTNSNHIFNALKMQTNNKNASQSKWKGNLFIFFKSFTPKMKIKFPGYFLILIVCPPIYWFFFSCGPGLSEKVSRRAILDRFLTSNNFHCLPFPELS